MKNIAINKTNAMNPSTLKMIALKCLRIGLSAMFSSELIIRFSFEPTYMSAYAAMLAADSEKLTIVCFSCESHSSAMVITSTRSRLKSATFRLVCKVSKMLTCKIRDSSMIIGME